MLLLSGCIFFDATMTGDYEGFGHRRSKENCGFPQKRPHGERLHRRCCRGRRVPAFTLRNANYDLISSMSCFRVATDGRSCLIAALRKTNSLFVFSQLVIPSTIGSTGLDLGADAYLVKPFAFSEIMAQIRSLFRRGPSRQPEVIRIDNLEVDFVQHRAKLAGAKNRFDTERVHSPLATMQASGGSPFENTHCGTSLGHELRQRH